MIARRAISSGRQAKNALASAPAESQPTSPFYQVGDIIDLKRFTSALFGSGESARTIIHIYDRAAINPPEGATVYYTVDSRASESEKQEPKN